MADTATLGDRMTAVKLILGGYDRGELTGDQAERLLDALILPQQAPQPQREPAATEARSDLEARDLQEQQERQANPRVDPELQQAIEEDVERSLQPATPIRPVEPGENLLENASDFVDRVRDAKQRNPGRRHTPPMRDSAFRASYERDEITVDELERKIDVALTDEFHADEATGPYAAQTLEHDIENDITRRQRRREQATTHHQRSAS